MIDIEKYLLRLEMLQDWVYAKIDRDFALLHTWELFHNVGILVDLCKEQDRQLAPTFREHLIRLENETKIKRIF